MPSLWTKHTNRILTIRQIQIVFLETCLLGLHFPFFFFSLSPSSCNLMAFWFPYFCSSLSKVLFFGNKTTEADFARINETIAKTHIKIDEWQTNDSFFSLLPWNDFGSRDYFFSNSPATTVQWACVLQCGIMQIAFNLFSKISLQKLSVFLVHLLACFSL